MALADGPTVLWFSATSLRAVFDVLICGRSRLEFVKLCWFDCD